MKMVKITILFLALSIFCVNGFCKDIKTVDDLKNIKDDLAGVYHLKTILI